jgi:hypothetical protein
VPDAPCVVLSNGTPGGEVGKSLTHNDMPRNGLTPDALKDHSTRMILDAIMNGPLNDLTLAAILPGSLTQTNSANVMPLLEYIISCALDRDTTVNYK